MWEIMNEYNSAEMFNRMFRDSEKKGYNTNYTRVNNSSYGNKNNKNNKSSNAKVLTYIVVGGIILFYTYKNVIKPAAKVVRNVLDLFEEDEKPSVRKYARTDDRVFDGQVRPLSRKEASKLIRSSTVAREDPMNPGSYIIDY